MCPSLRSRLSSESSFLFNFNDLLEDALIIKKSVHNFNPWFLDCLGVWGSAVSAGSCQVWGGGMEAWSPTQGVWPMSWCGRQCLHLPPAAACHWQARVLPQGTEGWYTCERVGFVCVCVCACVGTRGVTLIY